MLLLIIVLLLLFGGGGGYYGYSKWGTGGGLGIVGTVVVIALVLYFLGALRFTNQKQTKIQGNTFADVIVKCSWLLLANQSR